MRLVETEQREVIYATDGLTVQQLILDRPDGDSSPVLLDHCGAVVNPWEIELLRWPAAIEADLRRGGYLTERHWSLMEPWCNCAD